LISKKYSGDFSNLFEAIWEVQGGKCLE